MSRKNQKNEDPDGYGKRLLKQAELFKKFALPETEDEHTSDSENEYGHSEEEFIDEEASDLDVQEAWSNACENEDRVDEDNQHVPKQSILPPITVYRPRGISSALAESGAIQQTSKPAPIAITSGRGKCMMTCTKCGKRSSKREDIVGHRCTHTEVKNTKAVPPPPKARSCRPKEPPPERSHHSPPNYFEMGGLYLAPRVRDRSREPAHKSYVEGRYYYDRHFEGDE